MATVVKAPKEWPEARFSIFLAGSIDQGKAEDWQTHVAEELADYNVLILNPRRDDWDPDMEQVAENPEFRAQVEWEHKGLDEASFRIFNFTKDSKAPITFLELGEHADEDGMVACPSEFYREGNVDITCEEHALPLYEDLADLLADLKVILDEKGLRKETAKTAGFLRVEDLREIGRKEIERLSHAECECGHTGTQHELFREERCKEADCNCSHFMEKGKVSKWAKVAGGYPCVWCPACGTGTGKVHKDDAGNYSCETCSHTFAPGKEVQAEEAEAIRGKTTSNAIHYKVVDVPGGFDVLAYASTPTSEDPIGALEAREDAYSWHIINVEYVRVDAAYQRQGIGSHLYDLAIQRAAESWSFFSEGYEQFPDGAAMWQRLKKKYDVTTGESGEDTIDLGQVGHPGGKTADLNRVHLTGPACVCGHPASAHGQPPDFGCDEEKNGCDCKGYTEKTVKTAKPSDAKIKLLKDRFKFDDVQIGYIIACDPSPNQTDYISWISSCLAKKLIRLPEDQSKIYEVLTEFTKLKRSPTFTGEKDIQRYKPSELFKVIDENSNQKSKKQTDRDVLEHGAPGAELIVNQGDYKIFKITSVPMAMLLSSNTHWCTAQEEYAKQYLNGNALYACYLADKPYAQFHCDPLQFVDVDDDSFLNTDAGPTPVAEEFITLLIPHEGAAQSVRNYWTAVVSTSPEDLAAMASDYSLDVRTAVANNPHTPGEALDQISRTTRREDEYEYDEYTDEDYLQENELERAIVYNPNTSSDTLAYLISPRGSEIAPSWGTAVAQHPHVTEAILRQLMTDDWSEEVHEAIASSPITPPDMLEGLSWSHEPTLVQVKVARNPHTPLSTLRRLFFEIVRDGETGQSDQVHEVQLLVALAENPSTPTDIRTAIAGMKSQAASVARRWRTARKTANISVTPEQMLQQARMYRDQCPSGHPGRVPPDSLVWVDEPRFDLHKIAGFDTGRYGADLVAHQNAKALESWGDEADSFMADMNGAIKSGTIDPIIVVQGTDGKFHNWDGAHRLAMAHEAGVTSMPAWVGYKKSAKTAAVADVTQSPAFRSWFGNSIVRDAEGNPLVVYRGEHGEYSDNGELQTRSPSISFGSGRDAAQGYADSPNDRRDKVIHPRLHSCYLRIEKPVMNDPDDPFMDFALVSATVGEELSTKLAIRYSDHVTDTNNWEEHFDEFDDVESLLKTQPDALPKLYVLAYVLLDDVEFVAALKAKGFDGAIHAGSGETLDDTEFKIFSPEQAKSVDNNGAFDPKSQAITAADHDPKHTQEMGGMKRAGCSKAGSNILRLAYEGLKAKQAEDEPVDEPTLWDKEASALLKWAANYDDMFNPLVMLTPGVKTEAKREIQWAKTHLKREDRIVWYLRWVRLGMAMRQAAFDETPEWKALLDKLLKDAATKSGIAEAALSNRVDNLDNGFKSSLDHYFSLGVPFIDEFRMGFQSPDEVQYLFEMEEEKYRDSRPKNYLAPHRGDEVFIQFPDGWAWWFLPRASCDDEAAAMGHCGNSPEGNRSDRAILSLREPHKYADETLWEPHCTFILHTDHDRSPEGAIGEMKGKKNDKPVARYHKYIMALLQDPRISGLKGGGYLPEHNFSFFDLSYKQQQEVRKANPEAFFTQAERIKRGEVDMDTLVDSMGLDYNDTITLEDGSTGFVIQSWETVQDCAREGADDSSTAVAKCIDGDMTLFADHLIEDLEPENVICAGIAAQINLEYPQHYVDPEASDVQEQVCDALRAIYDPEMTELRKKLERAFVAAWGGSDNVTTLKEMLRAAVVDALDMDSERERGKILITNRGEVVYYATEALVIALATSEEYDDSHKPDWASLYVSVADFDDPPRCPDDGLDTLSRDFATTSVSPRLLEQRGQERLFKEPDTDEEAKEHGMHISKMLNPIKAYLSPKAADLSIAVDRGARPEVTITLDLGIPNFTVFAIHFPIDEVALPDAAEFIRQALDALLDEVTIFMISLKYSQEQSITIRALAEKCFAGMSLESATDAKMGEEDDTIRLYEGHFAIPMDFVEETQDRVITATLNQRVPPVRRIELTKLKPANTANDPARIIQMYRSRSTKSMPSPFYMMIYNQRGQGVGVAKLPRNWESRLLKSM